MWCKASDGEGCRVVVVEGGGAWCRGDAACSRRLATSPPEKDVEGAAELDSVQSPRAWAPRCLAFYKGYRAESGTVRLPWGR